MESAAAHSTLISPRPRVPRAVQRLLTDRRVRLLSELGGDVLDLSDASARTEVLAAARAIDTPTTVYTAVLSVAELVRFPDLEFALCGVRRLLAADGQLLVVEPTRHTGSLSSMLATVWSRHPAVAGAHMERDLTAAMRSAGLTVGDLERFAMPTTVYPLRMFVQGRARVARSRVEA